MTASDPPPDPVVRTAHGPFHVQGLGRFPISGDMAAGIEAAVAAHVEQVGRPPVAVVWDDLIQEYRPDHQALRLYRVAVPAGDPWLADQFDSAARFAIRADRIGADHPPPGDQLGKLDPVAEVARAPDLCRFIGWADAAPVTERRFQPSQRARSLSVIVNYRDNAAATLPCLAALKRQTFAVPVQIILVDNQSSEWERQVIAAAAEQLFGGMDGITVTHLSYDAPFNHSAQCNRAAAAAAGEVLVMMSNDCVLLDPALLGEIADWALEPGIGTVGPLLVGAEGQIASGGIGIGPIRPEDLTPRVHDTTGRYLAGLIRRSDGTSFACAALSRRTWDAAGGLDAIGFPIDYNDADLCLRLTAAGLRHLHLGHRRARHMAGAGDHRRREITEGGHARLVADGRLDRLPRANPISLPAKPSPFFADADASVVMEWCRLARRALERASEGTLAPEPVAAAAARLDALTPPLDAEPAQVACWYAGVRTTLKALVAAYLDSEPPGEATERQRRPAHRLACAEAALIAARHRAANPDRESPPAALPLLSPGASPDADAAFIGHADPGMAHASHRLILFADAVGPSQQILFLQGLARARAAGQAAIRIVTEDNLLDLRAARGDAAVSAWLQTLFAHCQPTAIVLSRFGSAPGVTAILGELARWPDVPLLAHLDDDFFSLPAAIGVERYREARQPRRIHALRAGAEAADLLIAASPILAERLALRFGRSHIVLCPTAAAGHVPEWRAQPVGALTIGYHGAATHNRDLEMIAPALTRLKADHPAVRLEIRGSVARRPAALALKGVATLNGELEPDYAAFRRSLGGWGWDIGLAPLQSLPFNAAKTPIKWTEYAENGIAVVASRTEPYLRLGAAGAVRLASPSEWHGQLDELVRHPERLDPLRAASARLLAGYDGWDGVEQRLLGLVERAAGRRHLAQAAA